jgi:hypothetical protein
LQWVSTRASAGTTSAPNAPIARQFATSSSWIACASASRRSLICSTDAPACAVSAKARFMRSIAQNRLTAVGRVAAISSQVLWNSAANFCVPVALLLRMPTAMPIAAATPIAGAPRITIVLIARATSGAVLQRT